MNLLSNKNRKFNWPSVLTLVFIFAALYPNFLAIRVLGSDFGVLVINGAYTQTETGILKFELGGVTPEDEFDQLIVNGDANLAGTLSTTVENGFTDEIDDYLHAVLMKNLEKSETWEY